MIWLFLFGGIVVYIVLAYFGVKRRRAQQEAEAIVEAEIDKDGIRKRRADGLREHIEWVDVIAIQVVHRTTDVNKATEVASGFIVGRHLPVDEPTLLVFHGEDNGAVVPAWPELVESLMIQMRHRCKMGTKELTVVRERIELVERGVYDVWERPGG